MNSSRLNDNSRLREAACVLGLVVTFIYFTWRTLTMFFSDDDVMNMYKAWTTPLSRMWGALILPWTPLARPLGAIVYRISYSVFGFHPRPLYLFCWMLLIANVFIAWRFFRAVTESAFVSLIALSLTLLHGSFQDLYFSAGTIYDQFCFLFTAIAVVVYVRFRRAGRLSVAKTASLSLICLMAMNAKESGATVPLILLCCECIYFRERGMRAWFRSVAPFYLVMALILTVYVTGRIRHGDGLAGNAAYQPHFGIGAWLTNTAEYLNVLSYRSVHLSPRGAAIVLIAMLATAILLRNRAMLFGWLFFVIAITPVALIVIREGYVLYVPLLGIGLYFAALAGMIPIPRSAELTSRQTAVIGAVTMLMIWVHLRHWPAPQAVKDSSEWRLADYMSRHYPTMKPSAKILLADDLYFHNGYDPMFNLRLLYADPTIEVARLKGPREQQPRIPLENFDHVLTTDADGYIELDGKDVEESIRLNILKDYPPGRAFHARQADALGYVVSGVRSGRPSDGWWTMRSAKLKFDAGARGSRLVLKFWVPDFVAKGSAGNLTVRVDGEQIGTVPLIHAGENRIEFPVAARDVRGQRFTLVDLDVDNPWREGDQEFGVVLMSVEFSL